MATTVSSLYHYPIKSLPGFATDALSFTAEAVEGDRKYLLVSTTKNVMLTQRGHPQLALLKLAYDGDDGLKITAPTGDGNPAEVTLDLAKPASGPATEISLWKDRVQVASVDAAVDAFFSDYLGEPVMLATNAPGFTRTRHKDVGSFSLGMADGYPLLIISEASLADLNSRLDNPVVMARFRPNVVVSGCEAFAEDSWQQFSIGETRFQNAGTCERCVLINVDPATAETSKEPFKTLVSYRRVDGEARFGINAVYDRPGTIQKGQPITTAPHS